MDKVEITVIGAGIVGLAIAWEFSKKYKNIVVLEKNIRYGLETSSRNSEVIHSGIYYPENSLKSKLCIRGNNLIYEICEKNGIPYKKTGKIIVALEKKELPELEKLFLNAKKCNIKNIEILDSSEIKKKENYVCGIAGIYSPDTGVVDSEKLMQFFYTKIKEKDIIVSYNSEVTGIEKTTSGYKISISKDNYEFLSEIVINSAGLYSDRIAQMAGFDISKLNYKLKYCKGEYFRISGNLNVNHLIYPLPQQESLGIHLVIEITGGKKLGPNAIYVDNISYEIDLKNKNYIYETSLRYIPEIKNYSLTPDICGIRPKLQGKNEPFRDFIIKEESENGFPGFINLIGIESPGLTSSLSIAEYVFSLL